MSETQVESLAGFDSFKLRDQLQRGITAAGFIDPRPIQTQTIPAAMKGRDILGLAQTGTGKTAAFALPVLEKILTTPARSSDPRALIVAPTRELAAQIGAEIRTLARFTKVKVATIFGGVSIASQVNDLRKRPEIVVACPGRLLDLVSQRKVRLDRVECLVLDEADHMFDMGFLPDIRRILALLPAHRQNLLFSATMPQEIRGLAKGLLREPHIVELNHSAPVETVEHAMVSVEGNDKYPLLEQLLSGKSFVSAIVFTRTKHRAKKLARQLEGAGFSAIALQGNMSQNQRTRAMEGFRAKEFQILVATDIAARGIDVEQVSHVINFDMPTTADAYTHRIGRTGRAERQGRAYTFVTNDDYATVRAVERRVNERIPLHAFSVGSDGHGTLRDIEELPALPRGFVPANPQAQRPRRPAGNRGRSGQGQGPGPGRRRKPAAGTAPGGSRPPRRPRRGRPTTKASSAGGQR